MSTHRRPIEASERVNAISNRLGNVESALDEHKELVERLTGASSDAVDRERQGWL